MTKSEELITEIQERLEEAATELDKFEVAQKDAVEEVLLGNFALAVGFAQVAVENLEEAKSDEKKAAKLLVKLIPQMHADGFADEIIYGVVETLIGEFLGA